MKALSGYAEWFWLIGKGWKDVENRPWSLWRYFEESDMPVTILIHASKTRTPKGQLNFIERHLDNNQLSEFHQVDWNMYRGKIIGKVIITGQTHIDEFDDNTPYSRWAFGDYCFWLRDGYMFNKPIPYRGQLGVYKVELPVVSMVEQIAPTYVCPRTEKLFELTNCISCDNICDRMAETLQNQPERRVGVSSEYNI